MTEVEKRVDAAANKALTEFKHNLDTAAAAAAFDYQRRLQDYNLFTGKRHEVIASVHALAYDLRITTSMYAKLVEAGPAGIENLETAWRHAREAYSKLTQYFRANELYLTEPLAAVVNRLLLLVGATLTETNYACSDFDTLEQQVNLHDRLFSHLTKMMREEIGREKLDTRDGLPNVPTETLPARKSNPADRTDQC
jgi:hypothetical protein